MFFWILWSIKVFFWYWKRIIVEVTSPIFRLKRKHWWWWCIFLQQYCIRMDIGNSKNFLGIEKNSSLFPWPRGHNSKCSTQSTGFEPAQENLTHTDSSHAYDLKVNMFMRMCHYAYVSLKLAWTIPKLSICKRISRIIVSVLSTLWNTEPRQQSLKWNDMFWSWIDIDPYSWFPGDRHTWL